MRTEPDTPLWPSLDGVEALPVFIMGLHRSGTTFLYQTLAELLPVAACTLYHVRCYPRILRGHEDGSHVRDRAEIDAFLEERGLATRKMDEVALSHGTVEEYGWILARHGGALRLDDRTRKVFDLLLRKLQATTPHAQAVLLKNPWDSGRAREIRTLYPDARFIFLRREPVAILNSQFRNALHYGSGPDEWLSLLMEGIPWARAVIGGQRALHRLLGKRLYGKVMIRVLMRDVAKELRLYAEARDALPPGSYVEVAYEDLVARPAATLGEIAAFLGLTPRRPFDSVEPRPRPPRLLDEVARHEPRFRARLAVMGLPSAADPDAEPGPGGELGGDEGERRGGRERA